MNTVPAHRKEGPTHWLCIACNRAGKPAVRPSMTSYDERSGARVATRTTCSHCGARIELPGANTPQ